jgi:hypothetical protein
MKQRDFSNMMEKRKENWFSSLVFFCCWDEVTEKKNGIPNQAFRKVASSDPGVARECNLRRCTSVISY